jgi:hypothetical protein
MKYHSHALFFNLHRHWAIKLNTRTLLTYGGGGGGTSSSVCVHRKKDYCFNLYVKHSIVHLLFYNELVSYLPIEILEM